MNSLAVSRKLFTGNEKHLTKVAVYESWVRRQPGMPVKISEQNIAEQFCISDSTVRRYVREIEENGYQPVMKSKQGRKVWAWDNEALEFLKAFYLAALREVGFCTMRNAYQKTSEMAEQHGWKIGSEQSAYVHLRGIHSVLTDYAGGGSRALDNMFYIARDLTGLEPFQVVVGDQHIFDFWVTDETGRFFRPECYLWLDMRTRLVYGIAFEPGPYNYRTVARALKMGISRFGKFQSTYNDNGSSEKSHKIDTLVNALQTYGMQFFDYAEMYRTSEGKYAVEDFEGQLIATADSDSDWRKKHRRIFANVKNAKTKPIERFFRTLEILLLDLCLPGYVRDLKASAAEDEESNRRLKFQKEHGYILRYDEFVQRTIEAIDRYEARQHGGLSRSPKEELRLAIEKEAWQPTYIDEKDIKYIFLESKRVTVRGNRVGIMGIDFVGPTLTGEMVRTNRNNLVGMNGRQVEVRFDPDDLVSGAWAIDPRDNQPIFLTVDEKVTFLDDAAASVAIATKKENMKAVRETFRESIAVAGQILSSSEYTPLVAAQNLAKKEIATGNAGTREEKLTPEEYEAEIASRILNEKNEAPKRRVIYQAPRDRYNAIIDRILASDSVTEEDRTFKAKYEEKMLQEETAYWAEYIDFNRRK